MLAKLIRQPLLHFLLLGAGLFVLYDLNNPQAAGLDEDDPDLIVVDRDDLLNFMQYRANAFQPELFRERLDSMSEAELQDTINEYVREEALYREALALGMDQGDYNIRLRLVQKVEFLLENLVLEQSTPDEATLQAYYGSHLADYRVDTVYTFTHIFFDAGQGGMDKARERALAVQAQSAGIGFDKSSQHGDRYPFLQNYVGRTRDFVANNFGTDFVEALDAAEASDGIWQGPYESRYGMHLVMLRERAEPYTLSFDDVRGRVADDYRYESLIRLRQEAEQRVVSEYEVVLNLD
jgi:hypothetical protein